MVWMRHRMELKMVNVCRHWITEKTDKWIENLKFSTGTVSIHRRYFSAPSKSCLLLQMHTFLVGFSCWCCWCCFCCSLCILFGSKSIWMYNDERNHHFAKVFLVFRVATEELNDRQTPSFVSVPIQLPVGVCYLILVTHSSFFLSLSLSHHFTFQSPLAQKSRFPFLREKRTPMRKNIYCSILLKVFRSFNERQRFAAKLPTLWLFQKFMYISHCEWRAPFSDEISFISYFLFATDLMLKDFFEHLTKKHHFSIHTWVDIYTCAWWSIFPCVLFMGFFCKKLDRKWYSLFTNNQVIKHYPMDLIC